MLALIGSEALIHHIDGFRVGRDTDLIGTYDEIMDYNKMIMRDMKTNMTFCAPSDRGKKNVTKFSNGVIVEAEIAWSDTNQEQLLDLLSNDPDTRIINGMMIPSIDVLYALKMSHRFKKNSVHFEKTMQDILVMREFGAKIPARYVEWYDRRVKETYDYGHPSLMRSKADFFKDDAIDYRYDHDTIHLSVMKGERPAYTYFKPEDQDVWCSKEMWDNCPEEIKLRAVYEESATLALERSQIPFREADPFKSFTMALEKVCTSITSGWFRDYAWEHYYDALAMYDPEYVNKFWADVDNGLVKTFK